MTELNSQTLCNNVSKCWHLTTLLHPMSYTENRKAEVIHGKIRLEISDLNNHLYKRHLLDDSQLDCGFLIENSKISFDSKLK